VGFLIGLIVAVHFAFLAYVLAGGYLAWRWRWTIWLHALAGVWIVLIVTGGPNCPLTYAEHWARRRAGETPPFPGFIDRYVQGVFFPAHYEWVARLVLAVIILVSWVGFARRGMRRRVRG
jgi:hypothetical protein